MKRRPTQADVAEMAGVSRATVSYVLNKLEKENAIPTETAQRVWTAIRELGYAPNQQAQHLRQQATYRICVILPRLGIPLNDIMVQALQQHANTHGYTVMVAIGDTFERIEQLITQIRGGVADSVFLSLNYGTIKEVDRIVEQLGGIGVPVIVGSDLEPTQDYDVFWDTNRQAAYDAVQHLIQRGHRHIAFLGHRIENLIGFERYQGYSQALIDYGLTVNPTSIHTGLESLEDAYQKANQVLKRQDAPTAIFCTSDINALTVISAAHHLGLKIPDELAVIGSGNIIEGFHSYPRLTTIGSPHHTFDDVAQLMMHRLISGEQKTPQKLIRKWQLMVRDSS